MIDRFRESLFGWTVRPPERPLPIPAPPTPKTPLEELLGICNLRSVEQAGVDAESRHTHGLMPGWFREIRDAAGTVVDLKPRSYKSMDEAGIDFCIENLDDPERVARARYLQLLVRRYVLLRERDALEGVPVPESAPRAPKPERAPTEPADWSESGNRRAMNSSASRGRGRRPQL